MIETLGFALCGDTVLALVSQVMPCLAATSQALETAVDGISSEFLGAPLYDDDFKKLVFRFVVDFTVVSIVLRFVYYKHTKSRDYLFTFFMINVLTFFICFTLKKFDLGLGMALGLFAIFGILRYRTNAIAVKEMTYLFLVIGIAVINALANKKMSYAELAFTNTCIVGLAVLFENFPLLKLELRERIRYEKIDLIRPEKHAELVADLEARTGLKLSRVEIGAINFLRDTVVITVFYYPQEQEQTPENCIDVVMNTDKK